MHSIAKQVLAPINAYIPSLTGLRFVAAMMVVVGHGAPLIIGWPLLVAFLEPFAGSAMAVFFVLSGFVIWLNYSRSFTQQRFNLISLKRFAAARFARLWPMYFVTVLICLGLMVKNSEPVPLVGTAAFLAGVQGWFPAIGTTMAAFALIRVAHLWSVSAEILLYATFPFFCFPIARLRSLLSLAITSIAIAVIAAFVHYLLLYHQDAVKAVVGPHLSASDAMGWAGYYAPYPHLFEFLAGCVAGRAYDVFGPSAITPKERTIARSFFCFSLVVVVAINLMYQFAGNFGSWFGPAAIFMRCGSILSLSFLVFYAARYPGLFSDTLSSSVMIVGGEVSYSIYLLHPIAETIWSNQFALLASTETRTLLSFAGLLIFTIAISMVTYRLIEVPARRFLRSFILA